MILFLKVLLVIILFAIALFYVVITSFSVYIGVDYLLDKVVKVKSKEQALSFLLKALVISGLVFFILYSKLYATDYFVWVITPVPFVVCFLLYLSISRIYSVVLSAMEYKWVKKNLNIIDVIDQVSVGISIGGKYKSSLSQLILTDKGICIFPSAGFMKLKQRSFFLKRKIETIARPPFIKIENYVDVVKMEVDHKYQDYFNVYCEQGDSQMPLISFSIRNLSNANQVMMKSAV